TDKVLSGTDESRCSRSNVVLVAMQSEYWTKIVEASLGVFVAKNSARVVSRIPLSAVPDISNNLPLLSIITLNRSLSFVVLDYDAVEGIDSTLQSARNIYQGPIMVCGWDARLKTKAIGAGADVFVQKYGNRPRMLRALERGIEEAVMRNTRVRCGSYTGPV
ncbi:MAG: hypothetical protein Q7K43_05320, partial [Candidatus Woesearchaeota archaeon]|nr:hypothetical protein [Candidatus Woesearchaeota archaeon]